MTNNRKNKNFYNTHLQTHRTFTDIKLMTNVKQTKISGKLPSLCEKHGNRKRKYVMKIFCVIFRYFLRKSDKTK